MFGIPMPTSHGPVLTSAHPESGVPSAALADQVISIIAEVTRYPKEILTSDASLEDDLGIDSVKRAEILAVLTARLNLPEAGDGAPPMPRTIGDVLVTVDGFLKNGHAHSEPVPPLPSPAARRSSPNGSYVPDRPNNAVQDAAGGSVDGRSASPLGSLEQIVVDVIAEVTRYPRELLTLHADLDDDLGFGAEHRASIFAALGGRLGFVIAAGNSPPVVRTIGDIVAAARERQAESRQASPRSSPAPVAPGLNSGPERITYLGTPQPFLGKVALVTGSGHGIGRALARHLAGLGASIIVNSFHSRQRGEETTAEILAEGGQAVHLWGSVMNPAHLEGIFREIENRFGGLDFFVSNASNGILAPVKEIRPEDWDRAFRTNVIGLHQASLLAADLMRRRGGGKIVALSSIGAHRVLQYLACIGTVKAAVESLVRYLAVELGADNIQVNAVSAGPVYGELVEKYPDQERLQPRCEELTPRKRLNDEQEVAEAVSFLLSSSGMSGSVLLLDAGGGQRIRPAT
jgi:NAD(P)-dependent dehydrogenase (short-subunit alcohol dehydrogenase family)